MRRLCRKAEDAGPEEVIAVFRPTRAGDADAVLRCVRILRSVQASIERRDCGTGSGGFKPGNKCAGKGGASKDDTGASIPAGVDAPAVGSPTSPQKTPEQHLESVTRKLKDSLVIRDFDAASVRQHVADLDSIPSGLASAAAAKGVTVHLGDSPMTELNGNADMKGITPRGWPPDVTWDTVPGSFNTFHNAVSAGKGRHGSVSLALHEYGHAVGHNFGIDSSSEWAAIHASSHDSLDPYLQQGGPGGFAGRQEFWAESFATHQKYGAEAAEKAYGRPAREFIDRFVQSYLSVDDVKIELPKKSKKKRG